MKNLQVLQMLKKIIDMVLDLMLVLVHQMLQEQFINMIQLVQCLIMLMSIMMEELINKNLELLCVQFKFNFFFLIKLIQQFIYFN